jgi:uncharacterized protein (UPF0332 family)
MGLTEEERKTVVQYRLEKARKTFSELTLLTDNALWYTAANRLYYASFYAVGALLLQNGIEAKTHSGTINQFGLHFVKTRIFSQQEGGLFQDLFELRQEGDFEDWVVLSEEDVMPLIDPVKNFIDKIEQVILTSQTNNETKQI